MPDVPAENLLVLTLAGRSPSGTVAFHPAFAVGNPPDSTG
jgi:predicted N-acetyltransferase YhbS